MLWLTMWNHGSDGNAMLSEVHAPFRPEPFRHVVVPLNCPRVCALGLGTRLARQPAPSLVIAPCRILSSTVQIGVLVTLRTASPMTGPPNARLLPGMNVCSGECGAMIAYDWPGWNWPGLSERPGMWMKRSQAWLSTSTFCHGPPAAQVA